MYKCTLIERVPGDKMETNKIMKYWKIICFLHVNHDISAIWPIRYAEISLPALGWELFLIDFAALITFLYAFVWNFLLAFTNSMRILECSQLVEAFVDRNARQNSFSFQMLILALQYLPFTIPQSTDHIITNQRHENGMGTLNTA